MAKIIKVRCNGPNKHVNQIDLDKALRTAIVLKGRSGQGPQAVPVIKFSGISPILGILHHP